MVRLPEHRAELHRPALAADEALRRVALAAQHSVAVESAQMLDWDVAVNIVVVVVWIVVVLILI